MKKSTFTRDFKVGLTVCVAIFILYFGMNFLKGVDIFSSTHKYYGSYENLGGLVPSAPVYIKGMKVGQVDAVNYDFQKATAFSIQVSVNKDVILPLGTEMQLIDDGLIGGKAILLQLPENPNFTLSHEDYDTIPTVVVAGLVEQLSTELLPKISSAMTQIDSLLYSVNNLVNSDEIAHSLQSIESTTSDLAVTSKSLKNMMQTEVPELTDNLLNITEDFSEIGGDLKQIDVVGIANSIDTTLVNLQSISNKLNDKNGTLGLLVNDEKLYFDLTNTVTSADKLLIDLKENPKRYVHFSLFGKKD